MIPRRTDSCRTVTVGTRGSALALAQTELAIGRLGAIHPDWDVEVRVINTLGDLDKQSPLTEIGGRGVFTNALESAILGGEVDAAVHSAKDLPTTLHPDAPIVAFPDRADPRDVLVSRHGTTLDRLPRNPVIGTSSRRRAVQIARLRPDAQIVPLRGNIDTRLRKADGPELDAIVLAGAGLLRMGWDDRISQTFSIAELTPSPAQGALAIQARAGSAVAAMLEQLDDVAVSIPVTIERAFLAAIGAGCAYPVGAHAARTAEGYRLFAMLADEGGERITYADELLAAGAECSHATELARRLRAEIAPDPRPLQWSAAVPSAPLAGVRVVVTRPRAQAGALASALRDLGAEPLLLPVIRIEPVADTVTLDHWLHEIGREERDWLVFTSANAVEVCAARIAALGTHAGQFAGVSVAAVGPATAAAARAVGMSVRLVPDIATAEGLAAALLHHADPAARVVFPRSSIGRDALPRVLRAAGMNVVDFAVYRTVPDEEIDRGVLERVRRGEADVLTFSSPSAVRNFLALIGPAAASVRHAPTVCAGRVTRQAAKEAGFSAAVTGGGASGEAMADAVQGLWRTQMKRQSVSRGAQTVVAAAGERAMTRSGD